MDQEFRKKILIVDTEAAQAGELKTFLEENGYVAGHTADYPQSMAAIQNWKPDLVILNLLIQAFNPISFIGDVRKNPFTEKQKIIIFIKNKLRYHIRIQTIGESKKELRTAVLAGCRILGFILI